MKRRLKILFVSDAAGISGAELVILNIMMHVNRHGFEPFLFCHAKNEQLIYRAEGLGIQHETSAHFPVPVETSNQQFIKGVGYIRASLRLGWQLALYLKSENIDVLYANAYPNCLFCLAPSLFLRKPLIWHVHNIRKIHLQNRLIYKLAGTICTKIITVSDACATHLATVGIAVSKFVTIYNGMDLNRFILTSSGKEVRNEFRIEPDTKVVGLFAQPIPEKGHRYFIEAAAKVVKVFPKCVFFIVGYLYRSPYQDCLERLVRSLGLEEHVIFLGWRKDIPEIMAAIDVMAHTRVTPEPAALVLMEAMAMKKPIVASDTGGTRELVLDRVNGILVPPADAEALAEGILYLFKNSEIAQEMGSRGRKRVEQAFTLERQIEQVENLILNIVK